MLKVCHVTNFQNFSDTLPFYYHALFRRVCKSKKKILQEKEIKESCGNKVILIKFVFFENILVQNT